MENYEDDELEDWFCKWMNGGKDDKISIHDK